MRRSAVYQFDFLIPKDYEQALQLDEQNDNSKWYDATKLEMDQINEYKVFQDHGKAKIDPKSRKVSNAPDGYQKIRVHLIFAVKHDGRHKASVYSTRHLSSAEDKNFLFCPQLRTQKTYGKQMLLSKPSTMAYLTMVVVPSWQLLTQYYTN